MSVMTTSATYASTFDDAAPVRTRITWLELSCLPCGEVAGYIEDQRLVRPVTPGAIRLERNRLRCGRCGGLLLGGNRGEAKTRDGIG
jgi:hypothetical protein